MKTSILACALVMIMAPAKANNDVASITNFNLNYHSPSGSASSAELHYNQYNYPAHTNYNVELQGGILTLETPDDLIQLDNMPDSLSQVDSLEVSNLNLKSNSSSIALRLNHLNTKAQKSAMDLDRLSINCGYRASNDTFTHELLDSCFNNKGRLGLGFYKDKGKEVLGSTIFNTNGNNMNFQVRSQGHNIKGNGKTYYSNGLLRIRIDRARVGIFNVRARLFNELNKLRSTKISVHEPWVEIQID